MGSDPGPTDPIYHYHSNYDSYHWMANFGDPGFLVHKAMGQYLTLLAYHLASDDLLPLQPINYATEMETYYQDLRYTIGNATEDVDTDEIADAIEAFRSRAMEAAASSESGDIEVVNRKLRDFQRGFASQGGLPNRDFFQHLIFAPGIDTGYAPVTFPAITEAVEAGNFTLAREWVGKTARAIEVAGEILKT